MAPNSRFIQCDKNSVQNGVLRRNPLVARAFHLFFRFESRPTAYVLLIKRSPAIRIPARIIRFSFLLSSFFSIKFNPPAGQPRRIAGRRGRFSLASSSFRTLEATHASPGIFSVFMSIRDQQVKMTRTLPAGREAKRNVLVFVIEIVLETAA